MGKHTAKASLSKGRLGWCVIYYHPVARTPDGKPKRVRRGLGTTDEVRAQSLVDQVNSLIEDASMHNPGSIERAAIKFEQEAVDAFYIPMQPEFHDPWKIREEAIPLPGGRDAGDEYVRVQFVGTTGAGKTTLVRQLLGTDPAKERFPLTSAGKATTADMEARSSIRRLSGSHHIRSSRASSAVYCRMPSGCRCRSARGRNGTRRDPSLSGTQRLGLQAQVHPWRPPSSSRSYSGTPW